jgi:hypothetical protein
LIIWAGNKFYKAVMIGVFISMGRLGTGDEEEAGGTMMVWG